MHALPRCRTVLPLILGIAVGGVGWQAFTAAQSPSGGNIDWAAAELLTIRMQDFRFVPDQLSLRKGVAYRLHFVNEGKEVHEFTAPEFFKAAVMKNPDVLAPYGNQLVVQPREERDAFVFFEEAGLFSPTCADHDWAGMTATVVVR